MIAYNYIEMLQNQILNITKKLDHRKSEINLRQPIL